MGFSLSGVLWKRQRNGLPDEMPKKPLKSTFEEFPLYFGKSLKTRKGNFRIFLIKLFPNFYSIRRLRFQKILYKLFFSWGVVSFFLRRFRIFLRRFCLKKKLYLVEVFPLFLEAFLHIFEAFSCFAKNV